MAGNTKIKIRNTSNEVVVEIDPSVNSIDKTATSINLFGKGVESYLKEVNENFYKLLENFASKRAPLKPQIGQLWYAKKGSNTVEVKGTGSNYNAVRYIKINNIDKNIRNSRGIALMIFDNNFSSSIKSLVYYDTFGSDAASTQLAQKLGTVGDNEMIVMASYDSIGTNDTLNSRMNNLKSKAWHKIKKNWRYPYTAIGTGKFGIISEDLQEFDDKTYAFSQVAFESLKPDEGMGPHTALTAKGVSNDNILVWNGEYWGSSASTLEGKDLKTLRSYILSGVDLSVKYDKTGGTVNGSVVLENTLTPKMDIVPSGNEIQDLGTSSNKYRNLHLSTESSIYMGVGKSFNKNSFVYTVTDETDSVTNVPAGSLILNSETGEAIVKKSNFVGSTNNNTFRKLSQDKKYGVVIGGNNFNFFGEVGIFMGSWNHGVIQRIVISTTGNSTTFGSCNSGGHSAGCSDGVKGLSFHQHNNDKIQYITISTPMNAVNFGTWNGGWCGAAASDGSRAIIFGGGNDPNYSNYVVFATPMSAVRFGSLGTSAYWNAAVSDGSKGIFDCGCNYWTNNTFRYVSLATTGDAIHFGNMTNSRGWSGAASNGVYGLWSGGHAWNENKVEKLTLGTPSNSSYFGTLTYSRYITRPVANESRMVTDGGQTGSTTMDYISFASGGSSTTFGSASTYLRYPAAFSGN